MAKIGELTFGVTVVKCSECERVKVVWCNDCKHFRKCPEGTYCDLHTEVNAVWMEPEDFCSRGEKKEVPHD